MKKHFLIIILCLGVYALKAQSSTWDYPIKPGSPEWATLLDHNDMVDVCQIPENVLASLSTEDLLELCLNYPLKIDLFSYNSILEGINKVANQFNGLQELLNRTDNAQHLLNYLKMFEQDTQKNVILSPVNSGELTLEQVLVESMLSHEKVFLNGNLNVKKEIISIALKNMLIKDNNPQIYGKIGIKSSAYLLCTGLNFETDLISKSPILKQFLNDGIIDNASIIENLVSNYSLYQKSNTL